MKKRFSTLLLTAILLFALAVTARAESYQGGSGWQVTFTAESKMESNFSSSDIADAVAGLQPGDDITFTVTVVNKNSAKVHWYMLNQVLRSLEDVSKTAAGGGYTYILRYRTAAGADRELFNSDTVGGENPLADVVGEGLHEATGALEDYFYLDTMTTGQQGVVTLKVALDGESQGNDYQDTLADLRMKFAVELDSSAGKPPVVKTGDETNLIPVYIVMTVSGLGFLLLALDGVRSRRSSRKRRRA